jgi:hypothetical protein
MDNEAEAWQAGRHIDAAEPGIKRDALRDAAEMRCPTVKRRATSAAGSREAWDDDQWARGYRVAWADFQRALRILAEGKRPSRKARVAYHEPHKKVRKCTKAGCDVELGEGIRGSRCSRHKFLRKGARKKVAGLSGGRPKAR